MKGNITLKIASNMSKWSFKRVVCGKPTFKKDFYFSKAGSTGF